MENYCYFCYRRNADLVLLLLRGGIQVCYFLDLFIFLIFRQTEDSRVPMPMLVGRMYR